MMINTFITSHTYDDKLGIRYPDKVPVERSLEEVERLVYSGHVVEWRRGTLILTITPHKFENIILPLFPDYKKEEEIPSGAQEVPKPVEEESVVATEAPKEVAKEAPKEEVKESAKVVVDIKKEEIKKK